MRREFPNNSPDQVLGYLKVALALIEELDPPEDLRVAAFEKAVEYIASKQVLLDPTDFGAAGILRPH